MKPKVNVLRDLQSPALRYGDGSQSASGEELRPLFGRTLMPSVLRPQGGVFMEDLQCWRPSVFAGKALLLGMTKVYRTDLLGLELDSDGEES